MRFEDVDLWELCQAEVPPVSPLGHSCLGN
jgi:hypothetical protein